MIESYRTNQKMSTYDDESDEFDAELMREPQGLADELLAQPSSSSSLLADDESRSARPVFAPLTAFAMSGGVIENRVVRIPPHRFTPLKEQWTKIYPPLIEHLKLQVRVVPEKKKIEMRTSEQTESSGALQKGEDFLKAFMLGFAVRDALALIRLDDLYIESFEVQDVKNLQGDHLARAIGRISGRDGRTKFAIENATRTRIVLADRKIHLLGSFKNIQVARRAICDLILGSPPGKVYGRLRSVSSRMVERF